MKRWFVVHTHVRAENKAFAQLTRQRFPAYLPRYLKRRHHARRWEWVAAPLFPRYLFVALDLARDRWRAVHSTFGVRELVCAGDHPLPVPAEVVEGIRACEDEHGFVAINSDSPFRKGDPVRVTDGAFTGIVGLFERESDEERVVVLLDLLGRHVKVQMPLAVVSAA